MEESFIKKINIVKVRHLENLEILISDKERKHLILTGKNGSGKSSLLELIKVCIYNYKFDASIAEQFTLSVVPRGYDKNTMLALFSNDGHVNQNVFYYPSKRELKVSKSSGVNDVIQKEVVDFEKFLAKKRTEQAFLFFEKDGSKRVEKISNWFDHLEKSLQYLFEDESLALRSKRNEDKIDFYLTSDNREDFNFNTLSDGYSSILYILFEIIIKMEDDISMEYDKEGIALIDEIETHLHVSLQKKILPFLTKFFPNIQFIVTTHSPYVLQSEPNAVIYDLEKKARYEDFSMYSSESILETYFDQDKFSVSLKSLMTEYTTLLTKAKKAEKDNLRIIELRSKFEEIPDIEIDFWLKELDLLYRATIKELIHD